MFVLVPRIPHTPPTHTHSQRLLNQILLLILLIDGTYLGMWKIDDFMTTIVRKQDKSKCFAHDRLNIITDYIQCGKNKKTE